MKKPNVTRENLEVITEKSGMYSTKYALGVKNYYPEHNSGGANLVLFTAKKSTVPALNNQINDNAIALSLAFNNTYGKNINPEGVGEIIKALEDIILWHEKTIITNGGQPHIQNAAKALKNIYFEK